MTGSSSYGAAARASRPARAARRPRRSRTSATRIGVGRRALRRTSQAKRSTSACVLPVPAPPRTSSGPPGWVTASRCAGGRLRHRGHLRRIRPVSAPRTRLAGRRAGGRRGAARTPRRRADDRRARAGDRHARRGRRPDAGDRRRGRGRGLPPARGAARRGHAFVAVSEERGARRLRRRARCASSSTRSTAPRTPSAGCRTTRSRSRSPTARRWPTSCSASCTTSAPGRSGSRGAARARGSTACRSTPACRERRVTRQARAARHRVGRPALGPRLRRRAGRAAHRLRAIGAIAVRSARSPPRGFDGMVDAAPLPRRRRRRGAADRARGGRPRRVHRLRRPARRAARDLAPDSPVVAARTRARASPSCAARARATLEAAVERACHPRLDGRLEPRRQGRGGHRGAAARGGPGAVPARSVRPADEAEALVSGYTGPDARRRRAAGGRGRRPHGVDRRQPALDPRRARSGRRQGSGRHRPAGRRRRRARPAPCSACEAGAISGFLAGRVLGQYEFPVLDPDAPARLLFVAPNLGHAADALDAEPDQLLRWVALHEITHALQFGGVPWLRPHLAERRARAHRRARPRSRQPASAASRASTTCAGSSTACARTGWPRSCSDPSGARRSTSSRRSWPCSRATPST